jgi:hypothetical protein
LQIYYFIDDGLFHQLKVHFLEHIIHCFKNLDLRDSCTLTVISIKMFQIGNNLKEALAIQIQKFKVNLLPDLDDDRLGKLALHRPNV